MMDSERLPPREASARRGPLGLPTRVRACLFDLDGVLTSTSELHREAWRQTFDPLLVTYGQAPFTDEDYTTQVDGRPRLDGVRGVLRARGIELPPGSPEDGPDLLTEVGLATRKNTLFLRLLNSQGAQAYPGSVRYLQAVRHAGLRTAVVTSSRNGVTVVRSAGLTELLDVHVDGMTALELGLPGKPAPDTFLEAARRLEVPAAECAVFEDALAGVRAGRAGAFGWVVGVDREDQAEELRAAGADDVVLELDELLGDR